MLRRIATSVFQAIVIVFCAEVCWSVVTTYVQNYPFDYGPLIVLVVYPVPSFVAALRRHNAALNIMIINLWLGWTIIGWIVSLIWACDLDVEPTAGYGSPSEL